MRAHQTTQILMAEDSIDCLESFLRINQTVAQNCFLFLGQTSKIARMQGIGKESAKKDGGKQLPHPFKDCKNHSIGDLPFPYPKGKGFRNGSHIWNKRKREPGSIGLATHTKHKEAPEWPRLDQIRDDCKSDRKPRFFQPISQRQWQWSSSL